MIDHAPIAATPTASRGLSLQRARVAPSPWRPVYWLIGLACLLIIATPLFWIYWMAASVQGTELNCTTWQVRSFQFLRDPFTGTQLTAIRHDSRGQFTLDPVITAYLTQSPFPTPAARWDLVAMRRGAQLEPGEAMILLKYLQTSDPQGENSWVHWTTKHPEHAALFWPAVRDTVLLERYDCLPQLFDSIRSQTTSAELKTLVARFVTKLVHEQAAKLKLAGDLPGAEQLERLDHNTGQIEFMDSEAKNAAQRQIESTK